MKNTQIKSDNLRHKERKWHYNQAKNLKVDPCKILMPLKMTKLFKKQTWTFFWETLEAVQLYFSQHLYLLDEWGRNWTPWSHYGCNFPKLATLRSHWGWLCCAPEHTMLLAQQLSIANTQRFNSAGQNRMVQTHRTTLRKIYYLQMCI